LLRDSVWQTSTRVVCAIKYIRDRVTSFGSRKPCPEYSCDVRVVNPRFNDKRADRVDNYDGVVVCRSNRFNELVAIVPRREVFPFEEND
jgi:hypothetical protein